MSSTSARFLRDSNSSVACRPEIMQIWSSATFLSIESHFSACRQVQCFIDSISERFQTALRPDCAPNPRFSLHFPTFFFVASPKRERKENLIDFSTRCLEGKTIWLTSRNQVRLKWLRIPHILRDSECLSRDNLVPYGKSSRNVLLRRVGGARRLESFFIVGTFL